MNGAIREFTKSGNELVEFRDVKTVVFFESLGELSLRLFFCLKIRLEESAPESTHQFELPLYLLAYIKLKLLQALAPVQDDAQIRILSNLICLLLHEQLCFQRVMSPTTLREPLRSEVNDLVEIAASRLKSLPEEAQPLAWLQGVLVKSLGAVEHTLNKQRIIACLTVWGTMLEKTVKNAFDRGNLDPVPDWSELSEKYGKVCAVIEEALVSSLVQAGVEAETVLATRPTLDVGKHGLIIDRISFCIFGISYEDYCREQESLASISQFKTLTQLEKEKFETRIKSSELSVALAELKDGVPLSLWKYRDILA